MTRRRLLQAVMAVGFGMLALVLVRRPRWLRQVITRFLRPRLDASSPTGALSAGERENLVSFAEVLVEERPLSDPERWPLVEHLDAQARDNPGYLSLYRSTARLLDRLSGTRFASLGVRDRAAVIARHRLASYDVRTHEYLLPFRRQELAVRVLAVPDLIWAYYRSPAGWAVVRYDAFPGRCGSLLRYTQAGG